MYEFQFDDDDYDMYEIIYAENPIKILVDDQFDREWSPCGRRPYYQMRGKRITEQQAFDIICKTDRFFYLNCSKNFKNHISSLNFYNDWFLYDSFERDGWVHPNGIIGTNSIMGKYPTVDEFAHEWARYLYNFPYLDLIIGITWWDEMSHEKFVKYGDSCAKGFDDVDPLAYFEYKDFCENIQVGIWVHDRKIEIIDKERTIKIYKKYEKLYEEKDHRVYFPDYYEDFQPDITTIDYLKKCLLTYGITDAEKFLSEKLRPYELERLGK